MAQLAAQKASLGSASSTMSSIFAETELVDHSESCMVATVCRSQSEARRAEAVCLVGSARQNCQLRDAVAKLRLTLLESATGDECKGVEHVVFVLDDFRSTDFAYLAAAERRICGPTIVIECAISGHPLFLPRKHRPIYCRLMNDVTVCMTGVRRDRKELMELVDLVHFMGGSVRKLFSQNITHLIARSTQTETYRLAISMGRPAMRVEWISECWARRDKPHATALNEELVAANKLPPFYDLRLAFEGFAADEMDDLTEKTMLHGGTVVERDGQPTHLVVDAHGVAKPDELKPPNEHCLVVRTEWFWVSIQLDLCANETLYPTHETGRRAAQRLSRPRLPVSNSSGEMPVKPPRRRSAIKKALQSDTRLSTESVLEASSDASIMLPEHIFSTEDIDLLLHSPKKGMSRRQMICRELLQTERNYVDVLSTLLTIFKQPLEKDEAEETALLTKAEVTLIFGKLPPVYEAHKKICNELVNLVSHWSEERQIGQVFLKLVSDLDRSYPPFVNTFDKAKETVELCDRTRPKFHAFLKACQSRPECQRQTLQELLIRPVQRLPSVTLLLNDILKHTDKGNADHALLQRALEAIKTVLVRINEAKRQTEDHLKMFDIFNNWIDKCPPNLVSGVRQLLAQMDVVDLTGAYSKSKGSLLTLFLFNDVLEVTKRRSAAQADAENRSPVGFRRPRAPHGAAKPYRHIHLTHLASVRLVQNIAPFDGVGGLFALTLRSEKEETTTPFQTADTDDVAKANFLRLVCTNVIAQVGRHEVGVHAVELADKPTNKADLSYVVRKAIKHLHMGGGGARGLSRTFSFSKSTGLRRAVSQMALGWTGTLSRMSRSNLRLGMNTLAEGDERSSAVSTSTLPVGAGRKAASKRPMPFDTYGSTPTRPRLPSEPCGSADLFATQV